MKRNMIKYYIIGILSLLLAAGLTYFVFSHPYDHIVDLDVDSEGNLYAITDYGVETVFSKTNPKNVTIKARNLPKKVNQNPINYKEFVVIDDLIYVLYSYEDDQSLHLVLDEYTSSLKRQRTAYQKTFPKGSLLVCSMNCPDLSSHLHIVSVVDNREIISTTLGRLTFDLYLEEKFIIEPDLEVKDCAYTFFGIALTTKESHLYIVEPDNTTREVFLDITPGRLGIDCHELSFFDLHSSNVLYLSPEFVDGNVSYANSSSVYGKLWRDTLVYEDKCLGDVDQLWFFKTGGYGMVFANASSGRDTVIHYGEGKNDVFTLRGTQNTQLILLFVLSFVLGFLLFLLIYLAISAIYSRRKIVSRQLLSSATIVLVLFLPIFFIFMLLCSHFLNAGVSTILYRYLSVVEQNLNTDTYASSGVNEELEDFIHRLLKANGHRSEINTQDSLVETIFEEDLLKDLFFDIAYESEGEYYYAVSENKNANVKYFMESQALDQIIWLPKNSTIITKESVENTRWLSVAAPVFTTEGNRIGYIQIGIDRSNLEALEKHYALQLTILVELMILLVTIGFHLTLKKRLSSLGLLKKSVRELAEGRRNEIPIIKTNDELQDICESINQVSEQRKETSNKIETVNHIYRKFMPKNVLTLLEKDNILELHKDDIKKIQAKFLFVHTGEDNLLGQQEEYERVFNIYQSVMEGMQQIDGSIHKDDDRRILCLFDKSYEDATHMAIELIERLRRDGVERGESITIQGEEALFGMVGTENDLRSVILSKALVRQHYIDKICKTFHPELLLDETSYQAVKTDRSITIRFVGNLFDFVEEKNLDESLDISLYQVVDAENRKKRQSLILNLDRFQEGIEFFSLGDIVHARECFIDVLREDRDDAFARYYLDRIEEENHVG